MYTRVCFVQVPMLEYHLISYSVFFLPNSSLYLLVLSVAFDHLSEPHKPITKCVMQPGCAGHVSSYDPISGSGARLKFLLDVNFPAYQWRPIGNHYRAHHCFVSHLFMSQISDVLCSLN